MHIGLGSARCGSAWCGETEIPTGSSKLVIASSPMKRSPAQERGHDERDPTALAARCCYTAAHPGGTVSLPGSAGMPLDLTTSRPLPPPVRATAPGCTSPKHGRETPPCCLVNRQCQGRGFAFSDHKTSQRGSRRARVGRT
jgi:hypothetical protein